MSKVIKKGYMDNHMYGNFKWEEFFRTKATDKHGCKLDAINYPEEGEEADQVYANVRHLVRYYLQPLRDKLDTPLIINSGYRCRQVNHPEYDHQCGRQQPARYCKLYHSHLVGCGNGTGYSVGRNHCRTSGL